ncbi:kinesin-like protein KIF13B isoform X2 [Callorhinchus milii]|uniref:kinesin-like protein KIF13B isoform X2 n=1 Tax=Callorhinchus milii TaxID=7868 RepID=UPI001C3F8357|nr:kinesin-like protein KIF13B isoform X2 [Callorhinchus milii]
MASNVKVAVRVRPLNRREVDLNTKCIVDVEDNQTILRPTNPSLSKGDSRSQPKIFAYDHCFWSIDESVTEKFAGQDVVFKCLGEDLLQNAFKGYNACIFAYGQTGSGKSYTMMGTKDKPGLIPRLCSTLFERTLQEENDEQSFKVEVSYMEIYNEKVRDLLDPKGSRQTLKVREHKVLGPYVDGLSRLAVASYKDIESLMSEGNKSRTVAATNMNEESSRSHAVFNIILTHTLYDLQSGTSGEKVSKLSLVDLAGSERAAKSGAVGDRLKEGSNINKSLTTLGLVISALADQAAGKNRNKFVPYRDSVLTWLLKDSLGGNSKTAMIATVSPSADNYDETLSTLRYADRAKNIINHAVVNEDPNATIIRELREEVEKLREQLTRAEAMKAPELNDRLEESEKLIQEMTVTWEQKLRKTEEIAQERQRQLESLGISLQSSGIKVGDDKCFLVNLNADPALNELLVYYLKNHTLVGSDDSQDIQLCGMGILPAHCLIDISAERTVILTPKPNSRTFVNGCMVTSPVQLHHGDRILWGNNHFFRINLPKARVRRGCEEGERDNVMKLSNSSEQLDVDGDTTSEASSDISYNYEFAQMEVTMKALGNNGPMQSVLQSLERQHEEEKRSALEKQRLRYEQELQQLRRRLSPEKPSRSLERLSLASPTSQHRLCQWTEEREAMLHHSLMKLREQIAKANLSVREANFIAEEMEKKTEYQVTLQIPTSSLDANQKRDAVLSEPAVQVRRKGKGKQIWSLEKLENRLIDIRELYQEWKDCDEDSPMMPYFKRADPFFDEQENHSLIGVANVFLELLFHDVKLQYAVPIINQKGEVAGRLHVEVVRLSGELSDHVAGGDEGPEGLSDSETQDRETSRKLVCRVKILQATGLPRHLSNFVFCQYLFWDQAEPVMVAPEVDQNFSSSSPICKLPESMVVFDHCKEFSVNLSEDLLEYLSEGALAIQVYGHKTYDPRKNASIWDLGMIQAKTRSLRDRWSEVMRKVELWVQVLELNETGEYVPTEMTLGKDIATGGVFQLRQGQSRRIQVEVKSVQDSGTMPLIVESVMSIAVGCVKTRLAKPQRAPATHPEDEDDMDSYQERDLERLRRKWLNTLTKRQEYLDKQLQKLNSKPDKSEDEADREAQLLERRLTLTEERNAVMVPSAGSGIPGSPARWSPAAGMETHVPVLFLDLSEECLSSREDLDMPEAGGLDATLADEDADELFELQIAKRHDLEVKAEASWDANIHESGSLSRATPAEERVFLIVRTILHLSHPADMQLVLRKRICVHVYQRQGFAQSFLRRMSHKSGLNTCGVTFEIVSNIPEDAHGSEDRDALARMAAESESEQSAEKAAYIEKYLRSVLAVENILTLDRLRQGVAVKELLGTKHKIKRRCISSPNVHRLSGNLTARSNLEYNKSRWESHQDISASAQQCSRGGTGSRSPSRGDHTQSQAQETEWLSGLAESYLAPVKVIVPQMPRILKSLFPVRDDKEKRRSAPPLIQQTVPRIMVQSASPDSTAEDSKEARKDNGRKMATASLPTMTKPALVSVQEPAETPSQDSEPQSPLSEVSSGYFSHSVSMATLSDTSTLAGSPPSSHTTPDTDITHTHRPWSCDGVSQLDNKDCAGPTTRPAQPQPQPSPAHTSSTQPQPSQAAAQTSPVHSPERMVEPDIGGDKQSEGEGTMETEGGDPAEPDMRRSPVYSSDTGSEVESESEGDVQLERGGDEETDTGGEVEPEGGSVVHSSDPGGDVEPGSHMDTDPREGHNDVEEETAAADEEGEGTEPEFVAESGRSLSVCEEAGKGLPSRILSSTLSPAPASQPRAPPGLAKPRLTVTASAITFTNPFTIQKVRTSELKSFTRILGEEDCRSGSEREAKRSAADRHSWSPDTGETGEGSEGKWAAPEGSHPPSHTSDTASDTEDGGAVPSWLREGEYVSIGTNKCGTVRYIGTTEFADGVWIGVELDVPAGKNDGSVGGHQYFRCNPGYGALVRPNRVSRASGAGRRRGAGLRLQLTSAAEVRRNGNVTSSNPNLAALGPTRTDKATRRSEQRKSWAAEQKPQ